MVWYTTFNDVFWLSVGGMFFGFLAGLAKCKYQRCSCWGIEIDRGVDTEDDTASKSTTVGGSGILSREVSLSEVEVTPTRYEPPITRSGGIGLR